MISVRVQIPTRACKVPVRKMTSSLHKEINSLQKRIRVNKNKIKLLCYLENKCCADCNTTDVRVLEFDHINLNKKSSVSTMLKTDYCWPTIQQEIDKCEVVCCNCHRIRTQKRAKDYRYRFHLDNKEVGV